MKSHEVPTKCMEGRSLWGKLGMKVFFHRYALLESANFPIFTGGNAMAAVLFGLGMALRFASSKTQLHTLGNWLIAASVAFFVGFSFVFTAPTIGRMKYIRRTYLLLVHYVLCRFMESTDWCTGTNKKGYINHLTAHKLLDYGYITPEEIEKVASMAIVRNPYGRMVSIYMYNRFGPLESFEHFVRSWYKMMLNYRETGEMEEWHTPCHGIPQFEYTHFAGKQLVQAIVKQEELKLLKTEEEEHLAVEQDSSVSDLPGVVRRALLGMPHANQRVTAKKWFEYYTQETLELVYDLYHADFDIFNYSPELHQRSDLTSPARRVLADDVDTMLRDSLKTVELRETRRKSLLASKAVSSRRSSMKGKISFSEEEAAERRASCGAVPFKH